MDMPAGEPRYRCRSCQHSFQVAYCYEGNKAGTPEKIIQLAMNGSSVRDTSWVLGVSITTVIAHLKKIKTGHRESPANSSPS
ncbi:IS1-like element transposase [Thiolinea disciformis]|uniref:IS1-like element transposase n=1 Tax=Thiolinea disciformis TaxID=125614 RepID=UPI0009FF68D9|nr:IS1-like element transposase [Thiolinea disciformis]